MVQRRESSLGMNLGSCLYCVILILVKLLNFHHINFTSCKMEGVVNTCIWIVDVKFKCQEYSKHYVQF